jgi:hypothetical protein
MQILHEVTTAPGCVNAPNRCGRSWRRSIAGALLACLTALLPVAARAADQSFFGVGGYAGLQYHDDPIWHVSGEYDWRDYQGSFLAGKHQTDRWDLWFEVTAGSVHWVQVIPDAIEVGATAMTSYDVLKSGGWRLYAELGGGFGWMTDTPDTDMVFDGVLGFIDYGLGIKIKLENGLTFKIGPRFHHRSGVMRPDTGMNSYGISCSITK